MRPMIISVSLNEPHSCLVCMAALSFKKIRARHEEIRALVDPALELEKLALLECLDCYIAIRYRVVRIA